MLKKKCKGKCQKEKNINEFHKDDNHKYGVSNICKICRSEIRKESYKRNKKNEKRNINEYHKTNKEKIKIQKRKYKANNEIMINGKVYFKNTCDKNQKKIINSLILIREKNKILREIENGKN